MLLMFAECSASNTIDHVVVISTAIDTLSAQLTNKCMQLAEHAYVNFFLKLLIFANSIDIVNFLFVTEVTLLVLIVY
jgi:hypothetical protein